MGSQGDAIVGLVARDVSGLAWLDGGDEGKGWLAAWPDLEIEADDLAALDAVDRLWRADRGRIWIGWLTYDLGADAVLGRAGRRRAMPGLCLRRYPGALELGRGTHRGHGDPRTCARLRAELARPGPAATTWPLSPLTASLSADDYRDRVQRARRYVAAGETYQVNLSQPFVADWCVGPARSTAQRVADVCGALRKDTPATMAAVIRAGNRWIVSNSPETLVDVRLAAGGDVARSWPIKGTRARGRNPRDDAAARDALRSSAKDAAEHVMIVDLVRNDLGRVARAGTVEAPPCPGLVTLPTVHHLVSEIRCVLGHGWTLRSLIEALFPGGSVTGAPKRRTIEIITELEDGPREIYCGAILVLEPDGLRCSIPIRTAMLDARGLVLRSGGGIVIDSDPEAERLETIAKARAFDPGPAVD